MAKLPVLKPREVVRLLEAFGFVEIRQRGSHKQFRHPHGRATTVAFHKGRDVTPVLLRKIARDIGLSAENFIAGPAAPSDADTDNQQNGGSDAAEATDSKN